MCEALYFYKSSVGIVGRLIINFRFANDTRYKMEFGLDRTKVTMNNADQREVKVKCQRLEAVENLK